MRHQLRRTFIYVRRKGETEWLKFKTQQEVADYIGVSRPMISYILYTDKLGKRAYVQNFDIITEEDYLNGNYNS